MARKPAVSDFTIKFKPSPAMVSSYNKALTRFVEAIEEVPDERKGELHEVVWAAIMKGFDLAQLSRNLVEQFGLDVDDAADMANHQGNLARAVMENARRVETGITEAIWMHSGAPCGDPDADAPDTHEVLNGKRFRIETGVFDGGKRIWPGTERGCKCVSRPVVDGFD